MIVSTVAADMLRADVLEVRVRGSEYHGLQASDWANGVPSTFNQRIARMGSTLTGTVLNASDVTVPAYFGGLTIENVGTGQDNAVHPVDLGLTVHWHRVLGQGSYWAEIETSPGVYNFTKLKNALTAAKARGCKTIWNIAYTPYFAGNANYASDINAHRSSGQSATPGWASPPGDLAASMQADPANNSTVLRNFITAAAAEVGSLLDAVVWWNEPNFRRHSGTGAPYFNWADSSDTGDCLDRTGTHAPVSGTQNFTQFVLMQACAYTVLKAACPWITFIGCDMYGEDDSQSTGGKQQGSYSFGRWLAAGGANYCDSYGWHSYTDRYQLTGIEGVNRRLAGLFVGTATSLETVRAAAGAPVKPYWCTEVGYNELGGLPQRDQLNWAARNLLVHASLGVQSCIGYAWDSYNSATAQMSWWLRQAVSTYGTGLGAGLQPVAPEWSRWSARTAGSTIAAGSVQLSDGRWCGTINGLAYVV